MMSMALQLAVGFVAILVQDDKAKLDEAGKKSSDWQSYSYTSTTKTEGMGGGGQGGGGNAGGPTTVEGSFEKGVGLYVKGRSEAVRVDDKVVVKGQDGTWTVQTPGGQGQGGGGQGGGGQGGQGRRRGGMMPTDPPHKDLADLGSKFSSVTSAKDGDNTVYSGDLTKEGAQALLGGMARRAEDASGKAKITVDKDGNIVKIEIDGKVSGKMRDREFNITTNKVVEFKNVGNTKVQIPEEAKKALEQSK